MAIKSVNAPDSIGVAPCDLADVTVVIPAFNEEASLPLVLGDVPQVGRVIVVNNGSTDGTAAMAFACGATVVHEPRRGYGSACLRGLAAIEELVRAGEPPPRIVAFLDADYSDHPELLLNLVGPIRRGRADLVLGSRILGEREPGAMPPQSLLGNRRSEDRPWFAVVPDAWRRVIVERPAEWFGVEPSAAAFLMTRVATSAVFLMVAGTLAWHATGSRESIDWLRAAFLTVAWFWLLSPTQNPWYWTWAMPLAAFAGSRAWLAVSGLALVYYLRFWLDYHWPDESVPGIGYSGKLTFDYVITWLEFAPWFALLTFLWAYRNFGRMQRWRTQQSSMTTLKSSDTA